MNKRLQQFLAAENISQAQFAETLGVARASISHILSGRNKPGFDFLESLVRHYPAVNFAWLMTGQGKMYDNAKSATEPTAKPISPLSDPVEHSLFDGPEYRQETEPEPLPERHNDYIEDLGRIVQKPNNKKVISKITVFFTDGTFQEIP
ncbi:MAG: helix-turn-helix transcriptional regulator [Bacteroidales bacterium]|nr:helix-turn-helix transcriptional regulator [Bacteroidales bacterium]